MLDAARADIEDHVVGADARRPRPRATARCASNFLRHHGVDRQHDLAAIAPSPWPGSRARCGKRSCSHSDLPTACPCAARKVLAMPPPMISTSTLAIRLPSRSSLVEILAPPTIAATGRCRRLQRLRERVELVLHGAAGIGRQQVAEAFDRSMRAVRGRERVVDEDVAERGELADEGGIVRFPRRRGSACSPGTGCRPASSRRPPPRPSAPTQSSANATGRLRTLRNRRRDRLQRLRRIAVPSAGRNARAGSPCRLCRRSRAMVGATRSMRVASATLPFSIGTLRSTRTSTRLPLRSA